MKQMKGYSGLLQQKVFPLLSGLFNSGLFSRAKPVPASAIKTLNGTTALPPKPDRSEKPAGRNMRARI